MKRRLLISGTSAILLCSLAFSLLSLPAGATGTHYGTPNVNVEILGNCNFPSVTLTISGVEVGDLNNAYFGGTSFTGFFTLPGGTNPNNADPTCADVGSGLGDELGVSGGSTTSSDYTFGEMSFSFNYAGVPSTGSGNSAVFPTITYTCDATNDSSGVQSWVSAIASGVGDETCSSDNSYMNTVCSETFSSCGGVGATTATDSSGTGIGQSSIGPAAPGAFQESGTGTPNGFCGANGQFPDGNCNTSGEEYGTGSVLSDWGVALAVTGPGPDGQCNILAQATGFTSSLGDGSRSFPFTVTWTGAVTIIAADPNDGDTDTVTQHGQTFSADTVFDTNATGGSATIHVTTADGADPNLTHFWCYADGVWYDWGLDTSGGNTGPLGPGCDITGISVTGPTSAGVWTFLMEDGNAGETGALAVDFGDGSTPTYSLDGKTFAANDPYIENPGVAVDLHGAAGNNTYPAELWCYSLVDSTWHDLGQVSEGTNSVGSTGDNSQGCFDLTNALATSGMSLDDPLSWVTGLAIDTVAVIKWAFVPCQFAISTLYQPITTHVPFMWISDAVSAGTTLQNAVITGESSGVCSGPGISPFTGATLNHVGSLSALHSWSIVLPGPASLGCTQPGSDSAGDLFGYRALIRGVWALILWLGVLRMAWKMLPWAAANDGIQILTGPSDGGGEGITDQMIEDSANNPGSYGSGSDHYPAP